MLIETIRKIGRWEKGRQGTGYEKCLLLTSPWPIGFDLYLLRYRKGHGIPLHRDEVAGMRHYRVNIVLKKGIQGGAFICPNAWFSSSRLHVFRSDLCDHAVEPVEEGVRYVLSLGWVLKQKRDHA